MCFLSLLSTGQSHWWRNEDALTWRTRGAVWISNNCSKWTHLTFHLREWRLDVRFSTVAYYSCSKQRELNGWVLNDVIAWYGYFFTRRHSTRERCLFSTNINYAMAQRQKRDREMWGHKKLYHWFHGSIPIHPTRKTKFALCRHRFGWWVPMEYSCSRLSAHIYNVSRQVRRVKENAASLKAGTFPPYKVESFLIKCLDH